LESNQNIFEYYFIVFEIIVIFFSAKFKFESSDSKIPFPIRLPSQENVKDGGVGLRDT